MKNYLIAFFVLFHISASSQIDKISNYKVEFTNKRYYEYDSTQKINVLILGKESEKEEKEEFEQNFAKYYIESTYYTYTISVNSTSNDSSSIICHSYKSSNKAFRFSFSKLEYKYCQNNLFKRENSMYLNVFQLQERKDYKLLVDSVIYTDKKINIKGYDCVVAISTNDSTKKYYICPKLPKSINPHVNVINSTGAVLGIESRQYISELNNISKI